MHTNYRNIRDKKKLYSYKVQSSFYHKHNPFRQTGTLFLIVLCIHTSKVWGCDGLEKKLSHWEAHFQRSLSALLVSISSYGFYLWLWWPIKAMCVCLGTISLILSCDLGYLMFWKLAYLPWGKYLFFIEHQFLTGKILSLADSSSTETLFCLLLKIVQREKMCYAPFQYSIKKKNISLSTLSKSSMTQIIKK